MMADELKQIQEFAIKWYDKFRDKKTNYIELVDHYMADDCDALGFVMDCGHAFSDKYGNAANNFEALERITMLKKTEPLKQLSADEKNSKLSNYSAILSDFPLYNQIIPREGVHLKIIKIYGFPRKAKKFWQQEVRFEPPVARTLCFTRLFS